jgi:hypothetical protein
MDAKLQEILLDYGLEGYGLYWYCLELIAGNVEPERLTFELEHDARVIARNTGSTVQKVEEMMGRFIDMELFENDRGVVTCLKLAKKSDDYTAKLVRSSVRQTPTNSEKVPLEENRLDKNRIENKENKVFKKPTIDEVIKYMTERQWTNPESRANDWMNHYLSNGFKIGKAKTPMKDWKAAVRTWEKDGKHKQEDYSNIPIQQIADEYNRLLSNLTGYNAGNLSPQMVKDLARRWNGSPNAQNVTWWTQLFSAIKNQIQDIEPTYRPSKYKFDRLVGHDFENVMNSL